MVLQSCHVDAKVSRSSVQWNTVSAGGGGVGNEGCKVPDPEAAVMSSSTKD